MSAIKNLTINDEKLRDLYLRKLALGEIQGPPTGKASVDKVWLENYSEDAILSDVPNMKIYDYIYENNKNNLDDVIIEYYGKNITYKELFTNVEKYAKAFKKNGVKAGEIVTLGLLNTPEAIYCMLALNRIGAISSMIDPTANVNGVKKYLNENNSNLIIINDLFVGKFKKALKGTSVKKVLTTSVFSLLANFPFSNSFRSHIPIFENKNNKLEKLSNYVNSGKDYTGVIDSEYVRGIPAIIVHSGGTTGFPKAVVMSDENVLSSVHQAIVSGIQFKRGESWLGIMPLFIIYGASTGTILPLVKGIKINMISLFNPKKLPTVLHKKKPNHMTLAPSHFEYLIGSKKLANDDLSYIVAPTVGGAPMNKDLEQAANEWLSEHGCEYMVAKGYGSSETCSGVTINISNKCNRIGSSGIPLPKTTVGVFDVDTKEELTYGESGEICVTGPMTMMKYLNDEDETNKVLKRHDDGKIWVHTGDYGYVDEEGHIYVTDRIKRIIFTAGGFKVLPSYVESVIQKHKMVKDCCVVGGNDSNHVQGEVPFAFLSLNDGEDSDKVLEEIKEICELELKDKLSVPKKFFILDEMPYKLSNGKIDEQKLRKIASEQANCDYESRNSEFIKKLLLKVKGK